MSSVTPRRSLLELTRKLNNFHIDTSSCLPFVCESHQVGLISPDIAEQLKKYPDILTVTEDKVSLSPRLDNPQRRNVEIEKMLLDLRERKTFDVLNGWRDECYEIRPSFSSPALFKMERSATVLFGVGTYGVHINGYVNHSSLGLCLWFQKRSLTKPTWPGMMDNFVGGGLSESMGVLEAAIKEAEEEANVPKELAVTMKSAGAVTFRQRSGKGIETEFVFDLELPETFIPSNNDGEVESFTLVPAGEVVELISAENFKTSSIAIPLDWLIRRGIVTAETDPELPTIIQNIHLSS